MWVNYSPRCRSEWLLKANVLSLKKSKQDQKTVICQPCEILMEKEQVSWRCRQGNEKRKSIKDSCQTLLSKQTTHQETQNNSKVYFFPKKPDLLPTQQGFQGQSKTKTSQPFFLHQHWLFNQALFESLTKSCTKICNFLWLPILLFVSVMLSPHALLFV